MNQIRRIAPHITPAARQQARRTRIMGSRWSRAHTKRQIRRARAQEAAFAAAGR